jgi:hypothetical protein
VAFAWTDESAFNAAAISSGGAEDTSTMSPTAAASLDAGLGSDLGHSLLFAPVESDAAGIPRGQTRASTPATRSLVPGLMNISTGVSLLLR